MINRRDFCKGCFGNVNAIVRQLCIQQLRVNVQTCLAQTDEGDLDKLARLADEYHVVTSMSVSSINPPSTASDVLRATSIERPRDNSMKYACGFRLPTKCNRRVSANFRETNFSIQLIRLISQQCRT
ncbi:hypothetical protein M514_00607 [Trichuris suis]|uniref:Uncharacterized protein n=1 Tax=Trichuris suis TaxID=68888 RepID=A0A085MMD5_9BILA|nr:hypothetical protein M513_00607 [Trichuris suis]KFD65296.1 hypothetical protein M514_00607 [Trichuris suis]